MSYLSPTVESTMTVELRGLLAQLIALGSHMDQLFDGTDAYDDLGPAYASAHNSLKGLVEASRMMGPSNATVNYRGAIEPNLRLIREQLEGRIPSTDAIIDAMSVTDNYVSQHAPPISSMMCAALTVSFMGCGRSACSARASSSSSTAWPAAHAPASARPAARAARTTARPVPLSSRQRRTTACSTTVTHGMCLTRSRAREKRAPRWCVPWRTARLRPSWGAAISCHAKSRSSRLQKIIIPSVCLRGSS